MSYDLSDMLRKSLAEANETERIAQQEMGIGQFLTGVEQAKRHSTTRLAPHGGCDWKGCQECFPKESQGTIDTLDASDLDVIRRSLDLRYSILNDDPSESDLPALSEIVRVQAKLGAIGQGGTFVAIPF